MDFLLGKALSMSDVLRKAQPPVVLTNKRAAAFAKGFPDEVKRLGLDMDAIRDIAPRRTHVSAGRCGAPDSFRQYQPVIGET
ncbi:hypothetical protein [Streptomyces lasiicapitis]|uniref:hypothetical protein n=1 Tax=Streptomyces lasiicapitis TaxID=1923961 RepID=UPI0036C2DEEA